MPISIVQNFATSGLNSDLIPSVIPGGFITHCENMRSVSGGISPFGGYSELYEFPAGTDPYDLIFVNTAGQKTWVIPCVDKIYELHGTLVDVTPDGMVNVGDATAWSCTDLSGIPVLNHPATGPLYKTSADDKFLDLPFTPEKTWAQAGQLCDIMVAHKQFLFALGVTNNGYYAPDSIRWSAPADIGGIPNNWSELDVTSTAGYTHLGGSGGPIIGALPMRDALVVYRTNGISVFDYIGGRYVWRIRHMTSTAGILSRDSVVDVNGIHFFISDGDIMRNDGNAISSIADGRIKRRLRAINKEAYKTCYAVHNPANTEILFCLPTVSSDLPDIAYIYNYTNDSWFSRGLPYNRKSRYGGIISEDTSWDNADIPWDGNDQSWDKDSTTPFDNSIVSIVPYDQDLGTPAKIIVLSAIIGFNSKPFNSIIERTDYVINSISQTTTIQRVYPHIQGGDIVQIQVGSQQTPGGAISWKSPRSFNPNTQRKVDVRTTGLLHAFRIISNNVTSSFIVSGLDFEYVVAGSR